MRRTLPFLAPLALAALLALASPSFASSQNFDAVEIEAQLIRSGVYMLTGQGGNIGVFVGDDGVFVIDDQYAPLTDKILAAIRTRPPSATSWLRSTTGCRTENGPSR